ncbi:MAG: HAD-IIIC family phosphatase [Bryobacteraceae bacterium]
MKLREALEIIHSDRSGAAQIQYLLGFSATPNPLQTFLQAFLLTRQSSLAVGVDTLPYGDLIGALEGRDPNGYAGAAIVVEWYDLDPRLGFRRLGGWARSAIPDIVATVQQNLQRLRAAIQRLAAAMPVAISLPTLPLPPISITAPPQAHEYEAKLWTEAWTFAGWCASRRNVRLLNPADLDRDSPTAARFDFRAELGQGSPYKLAHASALAELLSRLLAPEPALKGLITDLDDTLWKGLLGEVGPAGVAFTLQGGAQIHGLYQQFLQSLAERGVLLAIATKNDPALVDQALARPDLLVTKDSFFPVEAHWGPKSESVERILNAWNVGPEAVAFIDDSPMEAAEVQSRFPELRCLRFTANDPSHLLQLFDTLRQWYGKSAIRAEDRLRVESVRNAASLDASRDGFLATLQSRVTFHLSRDSGDDRAFELLNKTNQFNLNGRRLTLPDWARILADPEAFLLTVEYTDKFGSLGKIAVIIGHSRGASATIEYWALSCRAFSRRIEHATLAHLFDRLGVEAIALDYAPTDRNGPVREFLAGLEISPKEPVISLSAFEARCPHLQFVPEDFPAHV